MKKIICFLILTIGFVSTSIGQMVLEKRMESKRMDAEKLVDGYYCGKFEGLDCWVMEGRRGVKQVVLTDGGLEPLCVVAVDGTDESRLLAATLCEGHVGLLLDDRSMKGHALVMKANVQLPTAVSEETSDQEGGKVEIDTLLNINCDKGDEVYAWGAVSGSGEKVALVSVVEFVKVKQYTARAMMMDRRMNVLWDKEYALGSMGEMAVTDDGLLVTMGHEVAENETHFVFNVINEKKSESYDVVLKCDPLREVKLAGVAGHSAIVVGTYNAPNMKMSRGVTGGMFAMSFSADSGNIAGFLERPVMNEEMNIMYNKATKKTQRDMVIENLHMLGTTTTSYGAAMAVGRTFREDYTNANGSGSSTHHAIGVNVLAVDTLGNVLWTRNIRRNDKQKEDDDLMKVCLVGCDSTVVLLKSEHVKYPATYNIASSAKEFTCGDKNNIVMYAITPNGNVKKDIVESKTKHTLLRTIVGAEGELMLFSVRGNKTREAILKGVR